MTARVPDQSSATERLYTRQFFQVFGAIVLFLTSWSLQFHFGQYLEYLGHDVETLGRVLGLGIVGTLLIRLHIGRWIDRFGCRPTWLVGTISVAAAAGLMQFTGSLWGLVALRTVSTMAFAAVMTTVAVFAAHIAPPRRRAESLGTLGMAGFTGMMIGSTLGDFIFAGRTDAMAVYRIFFTASAACSLAAGIIMLLPDLPERCGPARRSDTGEHDKALSSVTRIILKHWPGAVLLVGFCFTMAFCLQLSFLERLAEARGFKNIKVFFLVYGPTAIILRIIFRRVPEQLGRTRTLVGGLVLMAAGVLCLVGIKTELGLVLPALLMGAGHCFIYPSMVDLAAERLPPEHRGVGTSLILGAGDLGLLTGFLVFGAVIDRCGFDVAIMGLAGAILLSAAVYALSRRDAILGRKA